MPGTRPGWPPASSASGTTRWPPAIERSEPSSPPADRVRRVRLGPDWFRAQVANGADPFAEIGRLQREGRAPALAVWGLTLVSDRPLADDAVELFVGHAAGCGVAEFELADPLNDLRNLEVAAKAVKRARRRLVGVLCHTVSPVHGPEVWPQLAVGLRTLGCAEIVVDGQALNSGSGDALEKVVGDAARVPVSAREAAGTPVPRGARAEMQKVREELGYPPLAGPIGRMVVRQAELNLGPARRYENLAPGLKDYLQGLYGRPPGPVSEELMRSVLWVDEPITIRPGRLLRSELPRPGSGRRREGGLDAGRLLLHMLFPQMPGGDSSPDREEKARPPEAAAAQTAAGDPPAAEPAVQPATVEYEVEVEGEVFKVRVTGSGIGSVAAAPASNPSAAAPPAPAGAAPPSNQSLVVAPMQGLIVKIPVAAGDSVGLGDVVAVLEAMKMQNDIVTTVAGKVAQVYVSEGQVVSPNQPLVGIA